jgi:hypothetical protein
MHLPKQGHQEAPLASPYQSAGSLHGLLACTCQAFACRPSHPSRNAPHGAVCSDADPLPGLPSAACGLPGLRHLSLTYPCPGAIPPTAELPSELSLLTRLTALQLKWVPAQRAPEWLGELSQLQHLLYSPYLPADAPGEGGRGVS